MPITGGQIITRAADILKDDGNIRWVLTELVRWLNTGQRMIVMYRPDAKYTVSAVKLVAGTKQTVPEGGLKLIDVSRNMGADGETPGRAIKLISKELLDAQDPNWHVTANATGVIKHYVFDVRTPLDYYVYPQVPAAPDVYVELAHSVMPAELMDADDDIDVPDIYEDPLLNYLLSRCYAKDASYAGDTNRAAIYYQMFLGSLGIKTKIDVTGSPNTNQRPMNVPATDGNNIPGITS